MYVRLPGIGASSSCGARPAASEDDAVMLMKKRAIVADSPGPAKAADAGRAPGPLEGATFVTGAAALAQLPPPGPREIAFAGRSNVGKSSAINALARRTRLAHASRTPGRTQQINFFRLRSGALIADLPGYGYAAVPRALKASWQEFLWAYVRTRIPLIGLVLVVDARHGLKSADLDLLAAFLPSGRPVLVLATKSDKLNSRERRVAVTGIGEAIRTVFPDHAGSTPVLAFSATSGAGVAEASDTLARWLGP
jgi:GTP-binding protein